MTPTEEEILEWWKSEEAERYRKKIMSTKTDCNLIRMTMIAVFPSFDYLQYNKKTGVYSYLYFEGDELILP